MRTIHFQPTGPLLQYSADQQALVISDLNPEVRAVWRFRRWGLFKLGLRVLRAAIT